MPIFGNRSNPPTPRILRNFSAVNIAIGVVPPMNTHQFLDHFLPKTFTKNTFLYVSSTMTKTMIFHLLSSVFVRLIPGSSPAPGLVGALFDPRAAVRHHGAARAGRPEPRPATDQPGKVLQRAAGGLLRHVWPWWKVGAGRRWENGDDGVGHTYIYI